MTALDDLLAAQRAERADLEAQAAARLVTAYGQAWQAIERDLRALTEAIDAARSAGVEITPALLRASGHAPVLALRGESPADAAVRVQDRYRALLAQVETQINGLAAQAGPLVRAQQATAIAAAARHAEELARATMGTPPPGIVSTWNRAPIEAVQQLVGTLADGTPLGELLAAFGPDARAAAEQALTTGLLRGYHPTRIARDLSGAVKQMGQVRALRLARSAMLDAYRDSTLAAYRQNDMITSYRRIAAYGPRTCLACLALSGTIYPLGRDFSRHASCRCALIPVVRSWAELGYPGIPQPSPPETGAAWFARQPEATQREMLGPTAYPLFVSGDIDLADFVQEGRNKWGPFTVQKPLGQVLAGREALAAD